jgi:hypothetical protein
MRYAFLGWANLRQGGFMQFRKIILTAALCLGFGALAGCNDHDETAAADSADDPAAYSRPTTSPATGIATDDVDSSAKGMSPAVVGTVNRQNTMTDPSRRRHSPPLPASDVVATAPLDEGVTPVPDVPDNYSMPGSYALVVYFNPGHTDLNSRAKEQLKSFQGYIVPNATNKVFVAAWPDHSAAMSTVSSERLNRGDISLVQARLNSIKKAIGTSHDFVGYNMAESNNWLARTMRTRDAEMDSVFAKQDPAAPLRDDVSYFGARGGASKAVIILKAGNNTGY